MNFLEGSLVIIVEEVRVLEAIDEQAIDRSLIMDSARHFDSLTGIFKHLL